MPPTVVHVALGGLVAAGLLGAAFDRRSAAAVALAAGAPDLDALASVAVGGLHGVLLHSLLWPALAAALLYYDTRVRESSRLRARYGWRGVRVAWVSLGAFVVAGVGLDLFNLDAANVLWPLHDQFYAVVGKIVVSSHDGFVQTFVHVNLDGAGPLVEVRTRGSTTEHHVGSWLDPRRGADPAGAAREAYLVEGGWQLLLVLGSALALAVRDRATAPADTATPAAGTARSPPLGGAGRGDHGRGDGAATRRAARTDEGDADAPGEDD